MKDINAGGGILELRSRGRVDRGHPVGPGGSSVAVMRASDDDDPFAVFGTVYSASAVVNQEITAKAGVPQSAAQGPRQVVEQGNDNIFLTSFSQALGFQKLVKYVAVDLDADKIALVYVNNAFGQGGHDAFVEFLAEYGKELTLAIPTEVQQADFTAELVEIRNSGVTHVVVYSHEEENGRFMIQLRKMGLDGAHRRQSVLGVDRDGRRRRHRRLEMPPVDVGSFSTGNHDRPRHEIRGGVRA